jgi:hypothetical protein
MVTREEYMKKSSGLAQTEIMSGVKGTAKSKTVG